MSLASLHRTLALAASLVGTLALASCGGSDDDDGTGVPKGCNPLGGGACVLPFPSSVYELDDAASPTGVRLDIPEGALPTNISGVGMTSAPFAKLDGWSASAPILAQFDVGVSPTGLPGELDPAASLNAACPTVIIDLETGERVPHFVDLDAAAPASAPAEQAMIFRPVVRLKGGHHYGVAIRKAVKAKDGSDLPISKGFAALLAGTTSSNALLERARARSTVLFDKLAAAGVAKDDLVLAWDFTTRSDASIQADLIDGRDAFLAAAGAAGENLAFEIDRDSPPDDARIIRELHGTFTVPNLLVSEGPELYRLNRDANGKVKAEGTFEARFGLIIPACAEDPKNLPLPVVLYGHGLMGSYEEGVGGYAREFAQTACMAVIATDWRGMSSLDVAGVATALNNVSRMYLPFETLVQGINNFVGLSLLVRTKLAAAPELAVEGAPLLDATRVHYYGISQGGIYGGTFMAVEPFATRGVLGVPAANYSYILERSVDWPEYEQIMRNAYPQSTLVQALLMVFVQMAWDEIDPITHIAHLTGDAAAPYANTPAKQMLLQIAVGDSQVANIGADLWARTAGIDVLAPHLTDYPLFQLTATPGPLTSAATYWNEHMEPHPPLGNRPGERDNGTHGSLRWRAKAIEQIATFFRTGEIVQTCSDGKAPVACDCTDDEICGPPRE